MGKADVFIQPNIVFVRPTVALKVIHPLQDSGVGMAEHARNATHEPRTRVLPFQWMFKFSEICLPKRVPKHDHGEEDDGHGEGHSVCDLRGVRIGGFIGHVIHLPLPAGATISTY